MKRLFMSFVYAFRGIFHCIRHERNFRIHLSAMALVLYFTHFYSFSRAELGVLFLTFALVITAEAFNTAIERLVDKASPNRNRLARISKDVAAGAVLVSAIFAVVIGAVLFWDTIVFGKIFTELTQKPLEAAILIILTAASAAFIAIPEFINRKSGK